jgi:HTH-type transcriptional regulator/antitoxin HipB
MTMDVNSLRDLADRMHVSRQWVSAFERGKASAEIGLAIRLLDALGLRLSVADAAPSSRTAAVDLDALLDDQSGP